MQQPANLTRGRAAAKIVGHAPEGFHKVLFTNAGAGADENAIRTARPHTGRETVISGYRSCHHVVPPCVITPDEAARGLAMLGATPDEVAAR